MRTSMADTFVSPPQTQAAGKAPAHVGLWARFRSSSLRWSGKGALTLLDQGLISGSNFLMSILLARQLTPEGYGAYSLAFEFFLLLALIYGAMMLEPMSVFGSSVYRSSLSEYLGSLIRIHSILSVLLLSLVG